MLSHAVNAVEQFLLEAGADRMTHAHGRSLFEHLVGTRAILRVWAQPAWLQDAGLLHSIYSTEIYRPQLLRRSRRHEVRALVGEQAERTADLFCRLPRKQFLSLIERHGRVPDRGLKLRLIGADCDGLIDAQDVRALLVLLMANEAEQACGSGGGPGLWLARVSRMAVSVGEGATSVPPVFNRCTSVVSYGQELTACASYLRAVSALGASPQDADLQLRAAIHDCPWVAEPYIWRACLELNSGRFTQARWLIGTARRIMADWGTSWDKRITGDEWEALLSAAERGCGDSRHAATADGMKAYLSKLTRSAERA